MTRTQRPLDDDLRKVLEAAREVVRHAKNPSGYTHGNKTLTGFKTSYRDAMIALDAALAAYDEGEKQPA